MQIFLNKSKLSEDNHISRKKPMVEESRLVQTCTENLILTLGQIVTGKGFFFEKKTFNGLARNTSTLMNKLM